MDGSGFEEEKWLIAPGMLGNYEVSDMGRIKRITRGHGTQPGRILTPGDHGKYGHKFVTRLGESGKMEKFYVHRLVMLAFVGPPPEGRNQVRHIDGNASNNLLENLAWSTAAENMADVIAMGRNANANKTHCPKGHHYSGDNLAFGKRGNRTTVERICITCRDEFRKSGIPDGDERHGTMKGYIRGCKCERCREANASYKKSWAKKYRYGKKRAS